MELDCESFIYDFLTRKLDEKYGNSIHYGSTAMNVTSNFPYVSIELDDQYERNDTRDSSGIERFRNFRISINAYSMKSKRESKDITALLKDELRSIGITCTSDVPMQSGTKSEIYRRVSTYEASTDGVNFYNL